MCYKYSLVVQYVELIYIYIKKYNYNFLQGGPKIEISGQKIIL